jgi:hypothetical protein
VTLTAPDGLSDAFASAFAQVLEERFSAIPVTACLVWDIAHTPDAALAHIAEGLGLARVLGSTALRTGLPSGRSLLARRGTRSAVRAALEGLGYTVAFTAGLQKIVCDGSITAGGEPYRCGADGHWAVCLVGLTSTSTLTSEQVTEIWRAIDYYGRKAVRCVLVVADTLGTRGFRDGATMAEGSEEQKAAAFPVATATVISPFRSSFRNFGSSKTPWAKRTGTPHIVDGALYCDAVYDAVYMPEVSVMPSVWSATFRARLMTENSLYSVRLFNVILGRATAGFRLETTWVSASFSPFAADGDWHVFTVSQSAANLRRVYIDSRLAMTNSSTSTQTSGDSLKLMIGRVGSNASQTYLRNFSLLTHMPTDVERATIEHWTYYDD